MRVKRGVRRILRNFGYDVIRFPPASDPLVRRRRLLERFAIDTVLDIGANIGQYAEELRNKVGYKGRILSFEPQSSAFDLLEANAKDDAAWEVFNFALGDAEQEREMNISANSYSSSILDMLPGLLKSAPQARYVGKESVRIRTLDALFDETCNTAVNIYMKLDTQGFERRVLKGAERSLSRIDTIQMEMSLVPLYEGELLFDEMCAVMRDAGYGLISIDPAFCDPASDRILQIDGVFRRS